MTTRELVQFRRSELYALTDIWTGGRDNSTDEEGRTPSSNRLARFASLVVRSAGPWSWRRDVRSVGEQQAMPES